MAGAFRRVSCIGRAVAAAMGAWFILPFAGLEMALVWLAFHVSGRHDADYEMLSLDERGFHWQQRCGRRVDELKGSCLWATVVMQESCTGCGIRLCYCGKCVELGRLMTREQRQRLALELGQVFKRVSRSR